METLRQTLTLPENHKLHFDVTLPENFPTGPVDVLLVFAPKVITQTTGSAEEIFKLAGSLKNSPHFSGDPVAIQKALRDEWKK